VTTIYQGSCARCKRRVRSDENYLKAHLLASTAVFHWSCFIAVMKEPAEDATGKQAELCEVENKAPCRGRYPRHGAQREVK
jgi:hypothetical protein